jgi:hypothetical protein
VRRSARNGPKNVDAAPRAALAPSPARAEYTDLVELARRMSIPDDAAIRQLVDRAMGLVATEGASKPR